MYKLILIVASFITLNNYDQEIPSDYLERYIECEADVLFSYKNSNHDQELAFAETNDRRKIIKVYWDKKNKKIVADEYMIVAFDAPNGNRTYGITNQQDFEESDFMSLTFFGKLKGNEGLYFKDCIENIKD